MTTSPRFIAEQFAKGESISDIAGGCGESVEYVETVLRSVLVGMDMARPTCSGAEC